MVERILKKLGKTESDGSNPQRPQTGVLLMLTSCSRAPLETGSGAGEEDAKLRKAKGESLSSSTWFGEESRRILKCTLISERSYSEKSTYYMISTI